MPYRYLDDGGGFGLQTGLAFFISCDEVSNGTVQVDRADSTPNARTFTDVNTTPSVVASAGAPYTNQCLPASVNGEYLLRADDAGLQVGAGDGWTAAVWVERKGSANANAIILGRYGSSTTAADSWAIFSNSAVQVSALSVSAGVQSIPGGLNLALDKRTLLVVSKPTGSSNLTLYLRAFDEGSWQSTGTGTIGQTNAGTRATTINANSAGAAVDNNIREGPVMYWPSRLLTSDDRDNLFNDGDGLTYGQM